MLFMLKTLIDTSDFRQALRRLGIRDYLYSASIWKTIFDFSYNFWHIKCVNRNDRKCFWCKDSIEDDFHFVCNCTWQSDLKISLYNSVQVEIGNIHTFSPKKKFVKIMNSNSKYLK